MISINSTGSTKNICEKWYHNEMKKVFSVCFLGLLIVLHLSANAAVIDDLKSKISERNISIAALEKEIAAYQDQIEQVGKKAKTLQSTLAGIALEQKKITADIKLTEKKIETATLSINELTGGIEEKDTKIETNLQALGSALRSRAQLDDTTLIETVLKNNTVSTLWDSINVLKRFESAVRGNVLQVRALKQELEEEKNETETKRRELSALRSRLADQKQILELNRKEKNTLLVVTKNKESEYRKQLNAKMALRNAFEQELLEFESQLRFEIDPSSLPQTGSGVLKWPLDAVKVTQYFGNTAFAKAGAYQGQGHNGIDLRASVGTPIRAALGGVVKGVGNTDSVCPGASYGKWVLIEHTNGLSTLYAHFSLIKITDGQSVSVGEVIGYSGETGYATGPHLHFTVYATQGIRVLQRKSSVCKGTYTMPVADLKAYLNPLLYL